MVYLLFFVHIILFVVVLLALVSLVVHSALMRLVISPLRIGALVLLYHCTHYTQRGGVSSLGTDCGAFYIIAHIAAGDSRWYYGAALLEYTLCYSWWRFQLWRLLWGILCSCRLW